MKKNGTKRAKRSTKKSAKKQPEEVIDGPLNNITFVMTGILQNGDRKLVS